MDNIIKLNDGEKLKLKTELQSLGIQKKMQNILKLTLIASGKVSVLM
jgi:hypothetical protein